MNATTFVGKNAVMRRLRKVSLNFKAIVQSKAISRNFLKDWKINYEISPFKCHYYCKNDPACDQKCVRDVHACNDLCEEAAKTCEGKDC